MQVYWFLCRRNVANADWRSATIKGHEEILAFIRAGAEPAATEAIRMHISTAYSRIIAPVSGDTTPADDASDVKRVAESFLLL
jgi:DNA-binding GntR family transcriptional regulator